MIGSMTMTKKIGRPPAWTQERKREAQDAICAHVAAGGTLTQYCAQPDTPAVSVAYEWRRDDDAFAEAYTRAREARADSRADRIDKYALMVVTGELDANAARVAIDAEKWQAGKENQRLYGDRLDLNAKVEHSDVSDEALVQKLAAILGGRGKDHEKTP
jgi:hypothetical protein